MSELCPEVPCCEIAWAIIIGAVLLSRTLCTVTVAGKAVESTVNV